MNKIILLIMLLITILNLSACNNFPTNESSPENSFESTIETVTTSESIPTISLLPINTEEEFEFDIFYGIIDIVDDWIYYNTDMFSGSYLKRIRTDGTGTAQLNYDYSLYPIISEDWIFYANFNEGSKIYKMCTDGTGRIKLNEDSSEELRIFEDWIYYKNNEDGNAYRIKLDGTDRTKLTGDLVYYYSTMDDWIYFSNLQSEYKLCKRQVGSAEVIKLSDKSGNILKISDDWIYYNNWDDGGSLYRISVTGEDEMKLTEESVGRINIIKGWIYYSTSDTDARYIYRIRLDGTEKQDLNIETFKNILVN